jgi:heme/copper-type cytochrome/quinol oxidase subunit 2
MKNLINYFKKPIPLMAFGSSTIMALLKVFGIANLSWITILIPIFILYGIYVVLLISIFVAYIMIKKRKKTNEKSK